MSKREILTDGGHRFTVGWNPLFRSFYFEQETPLDYCNWRGKRGEITTVNALRQRLPPGAIDQDLERFLDDDRRFDR